MKNKSRIRTGIILCAAVLALSACGKSGSKDAGNNQKAQESGVRIETQGGGEGKSEGNVQSGSGSQSGQDNSSGISAAASLPEAPASDFEYEEVDGEITIKHYNGENMQIAIPAQIEGKSVTAIGGHCFTNSAIEKVVCPDSLETIEEFAFANCYDLVEIRLNEGLQSIDNNAFLFCKALEYVRIPSTTTFMGDSAFSAAGIKEIDFLCTSMECEQAVFLSHDIVELTVPSNLKTIGSMMFGNGKYLETVVIEEGVEKIEGQAFSYCTELKKVSIPASVTEIGEKVFNNTSKDLVLTVEPGSYAETYAEENKIAYVNP